MFTATGSVSQTPTGETVIFTDLSDYTDESQLTFTARTLYVYAYDGTQITGSPFDFSFAGFPANQITVTTTLTTLQAWRFVMVLTSIAPQPGSSYSFDTIADLANLLQSFQYGVWQQIAAYPALVNNQNFVNDFISTYLSLYGSITATGVSDQFLTQFILTIGQRYIDNPQYYF